MITPKLKEKLRHEMIEYGLNVLYLALVFGTFAMYRRLLLAAHDISYAHYGIALTEALILGKVIMIGGVLRLGRGLDSKPLIYPTLYKSLVFCILVALFKVIEHGIRGVFVGEGFVQGVAAALQKGWSQILANSLVIFVALLPFFGVKELGRVLGQNKITALFFRDGVKA